MARSFPSLRVSYSVSSFTVSRPAAAAAATAFRRGTSSWKPWPTIAHIRAAGLGEGRDHDGPAPPLHRAPAELRGWVRSVRSSKPALFVDVVDGSGFGHLQAVIPKFHDGGGAHSAELAELAAGVKVGSAVRLVGDYKRMRGSGKMAGGDEYPFELQVTGGCVEGESDPGTFPIQTKYQTPQFLRTIPHLRPRAPLHGAVLRLRSEAIQALAAFFSRNGLIQTHAPVITSSDCEGAGEVFTVNVPGQEQEQEQGQQQQQQGQQQQQEHHFFRAPRYLTVSSQLHLEALAQSVGGGVWALSPTFRAEKSDTGRHLAEFYMLEAEVPFVPGLGSVMDLAEEMLRDLVTSLHRSAARADWLDRRWGRDPDRPMVDAGDLGTAEEAQRRWAGMMQTRTPWPRITYAEAIMLARELGQPISWGAPLSTEQERYVAVRAGGRDPELGHVPVFVTHYPRDLKPFYMSESESESGSRSSSSPDGPTVECFDLLVPEMGELAGGSMREHRLDRLAQSMSRCGVGVTGGALGWYLDLRRWGCPRHGGFGLGLDRVLAYLTTIPNVRDVATFPRWLGRCDC